MLASKQDDDRKEDRLRHRWAITAMVMIFHIDHNQDRLMCNIDFV